MGLIPSKVVAAATADPRKLLIISHPKTGKTTVCSQLPNSVLIDFESGSKFVDARKVDVIELAQMNKVSPYDILIQGVLQELKGMEERPDYLILDPAQAIEEIAKDEALKRFKQSPLGKGFKGTDIYNLANGAGYGRVREVFTEIINSFIGCYNKCLIILGHIKYSSLKKEGEDVQIKDVNLTGQLKTIVTSMMDANGFLHRTEDGSKNILSFKKDINNIIDGSRSPHLRDAEFILSEEKDGKIVTNWDKVFKSIKN